MPNPTALRLERVSFEQKPLLRSLLTEYLVEFDAMEGVERDRDAEGHLPYRRFDQYWTDPDRRPFGICLGDELVGFCLLRDTGVRWHVAEFYVVPAHRQKGVGAFAVAAVKDYCRAANTHRQLEASTLRLNVGALAFWRSQGFRTESEDPERLVNVFDLEPPQ
jgi:predicted acetyltransferase